MSQPQPLTADFRVLLYGFIGLRLLLLMAFQPQLLDLATPDDNAPIQIERGLTYLGDFAEHYRFAQWQDEGWLPYHDYWVEFPPVWPALTQGLYRVFPNFTAWASWLYVVMLLFDAGNLLMIRALGTRLYTAPLGDAVAWGYAILAAPLVMLGWNFEAIVAFGLLGSIYLYLMNDRRWVGLAALGVLTKYLDVLLLPTVWKFSPRREALKTSLLLLGLVLLVLVPLVLWGGDFALKSLTVQFDKPAYQTIWAIAEGQYSTGGFPVGDVRFDSRYSPQGENSRWLTVLRSVLFIGVGGWLWVRRFPNTLGNQFTFFSLTVLLFTLWSQGWSPQWAVWLAPLIMLNFPDRTGFLLALVLIFGAFFEYPFLFRASDSTTIATHLRPIFAILIFSRTALLLGVVFVLWRRLEASIIAA